MWQQASGEKWKAKSFWMSVWWCGFDERSEARCGRFGELGSRQLQPPTSLVRALSLAARVPSPSLVPLRARFTSWTIEYGPFFFMVRLLNKPIYKAFGPSPGVNRMWTKRNDHAPKSECVKKFNIYLKNNQVWPFFWLHFLFSFIFNLNFSKHGYNGGEEEEPYFVIRIIHVLVHACEACCGHSNIIFARRMGEVCNFELSL